MRILYVAAGVMSITELGTKELDRRRSILQSWAGKNVQVEITDLMSGPLSIESAYEGYLAVHETVSRIVDAEKKDFDHVILGCFGDPGIDAAREMVKIPVIGPGESSILVASLLGQRFSILTVTDSVVPSLEKLLRNVGLERKAAGGFAGMYAQYARLNPGAISFLGKMPAVWVVSAFIVWGFFQIGGSPASVTRFLIPEDDRTLKRAMVYSVSFQSFIYLTATLVAIACGVLLPNLERPDLTIPTMISQLLSPLLGGIIVAAVLGAMMSTVDSILLLAGSLVVENVYIKFKKKKINSRKRLGIVRWVTFIIGLLSLLVALKPPAAILLIVTMSFSLMASAFSFPLLLGIWWPRTTKQGGIAAMIGGALSCVAWYVGGYIKYNSFDNWIGGIWPAIFGAFISLLLIIVISLITRPPPQSVLEIFFDGGNSQIEN